MAFDGSDDGGGRSSYTPTPTRAPHHSSPTTGNRLVPANSSSAATEYNRRRRLRDDAPRATQPQNGASLCHVCEREPADRLAGLQRLGRRCRSVLTMGRRRGFNGADVLTDRVEAWLSVVGEDLYRVSSRGRARSLDRIVTYWNSRLGRQMTMPRRGRMLSPAPNGNGRITINLCRNGRKRSVPVHTLVLEAFVGPRPKGMECCHWDDDGSNAHLTNLRWDTRRANMADALRNGRHHQAAQTACVFGHEFTSQNTIYTKAGHRRCRTCSNYLRRLSRARARR